MTANVGQFTVRMMPSSTPEGDVGILHNTIISNYISIYYDNIYYDID
jgi:hypothetical protein